MMESIVSLEEAIAEKVKDLSSDRQQQVLDFIEKTSIYMT